LGILQNEHSTNDKNNKNFISAIEFEQEASELIKYNTTGAKKTNYDKNMWQIDEKIVKKAQVMDKSI